MVVMVVMVVVVVVFQIKMKISFASCWKIYCTRTLNVVNNQQKEENQHLVRAVEHRVFVCCWLHIVNAYCVVGGESWIFFIFGCALIFVFCLRKSILSN